LSCVGVGDVYWA